MEPIQAHADSFVTDPDPLAYAQAATEWADLVHDVGTARLAALDPSEEGRPWDVLICEACQVVAQGQASPAFHEISTGADDFSWLACEGCGAGPGLRSTYRARVPQ